MNVLLGWTRRERLGRLSGVNRHTVASPHAGLVDVHRLSLRTLAACSTYLRLYTPLRWRISVGASTLVRGASSLCIRSLYRGVDRAYPPLVVFTATTGCCLTGGLVCYRAPAILLGHAGTVLWGENTRTPFL